MISSRGKIRYNLRMRQDKTQLYFFIGLLLAIGALTFSVFLPYLGTLVLAGTAAIILYPVYEQLLKALAGHRRPAALITIILTFLLLLVPLGLFGYKLVAESIDLYSKLDITRDAYSDILTTAVLYIKQYIPGLNIDVSNFASQAFSWIAKNIGNIFSSTVQTFFNIFLGSMALYYFLIDGNKFVDKLVEYSPLADRYDRQILKKLSRAVTSVVKGTLFIAVIQGLLMGLGFWVFGVPHGTLWGTCAAIAALIPGVGTAVVLIPAVAYLVAINDLYAAAGLFFWGAGIVGLIDNLLRPYLVGYGASLHPFFVLLSVLGGIAFFGPLGFLYGPILVSLLFALLEIYRYIVLKQKEEMM